MKACACTIILFLTASLSIHLQAQDTEIIKKYIRDQFEPVGSASLSYSSEDFYLERPVVPEEDERSFERIEELKDSLNIIGDLQYLARIGFLYNRLNRPTLSRKYITDAITSYEKKLALDPEDIKTMECLLLLYLEQDDKQSAIAMAKKKIAIDPTDTSSVTYLSFLNLSTGNYEDANAWADSAIRKYPALPWAYLLKTMAVVFPVMMDMQQSGTLDEIRHKFNDKNPDLSFLKGIAERFPDNMQIQAVTASCGFLALYYKVSFKILTSLPVPGEFIRFNLSPEDSLELIVYEAQFLSFLDHKEFKNHYPLYFSLGVAAVLRNDYDKAISYFQKAIKSKPSSKWNRRDHLSETYSNMIACYLLKKDSVSAEKWVLKKIKDQAAFDLSAGDYVDAGRYRLYANDFVKGKEFMNKAIEIDSGCVAAYVELANISLLSNDYNKALDYLNTAYKIDPNNPDQYNTLVLRSLLMSDKKTAAYLIDKMLNYNPDNPFAQKIKKEFID